MLAAEPTTVTEVADDINRFAGRYAAVHGILYYGDDGPESSRQFLLLPKEGHFDGVIPAPLEFPDPSRILVVQDPKLLDRFYGTIPNAFGGYWYKFDAIVIGRLMRQADSPCPVCITDLFLIVLQRGDPATRGRDARRLIVVGFPERPVPPDSWQAPRSRLSTAPALQLFAVDAPTAAPDTGSVGDR